MSSQNPPTRSGGMSLYANLVDPSSDSSSTPGTISRAPVVFNDIPPNNNHQDDSVVKNQISAAAFRFQPIKRPQLASQKPKTKLGLPKAAVFSSASPIIASSASAAPRVPSVKSTLADWTAADEEDVNGFYGGEKRQRGGRKKRKKNHEFEQAQNWDDIYDPTRPTNYEEYQHSEEKVREVQEWKGRLYAHRMIGRTSDVDSDPDEPQQRNYQFAPPPNLNVKSPHPTSKSVPSPVLFTPTPNNSTGDIHSQELNTSQNLHLGQQSELSSGAPPTSLFNPLQNEKSTFVSQSLGSTTISRPPVRYSFPEAPKEIPSTEAELEARFSEEVPSLELEEAPARTRPDRKGFAERLLSKHGWTKGTGLGASGSGIINPLEVKLEKPKKRQDSESGGLAAASNRAKIIGGKKAVADDEGKFGAISEVVVLFGMVDGLDLDAELHNAEGGGLMQEIGEECVAKYGQVERVYIDRDRSGSIPVFVKFTSHLSALRAVNALEGRIFNGNTITARFFDSEKFEKGILKPEPLLSLSEGR